MEAMQPDNYEGTRFWVEVNDPEEGNGSVTNHVIYGTNYHRTNKRRLRKYLTAVGEPSWNQKRVLKALGFWYV
tara:strand:- start:719 stop:937 length:219 start_codon:yes stop_codon:yes gene_type:complete